MTQLESLASLPQSFRDRVEVRGECWVWIGGLNSKGYACYYPVPELNVLAHRWSRETLIGPIQEGFTLDHFRKDCCKACVNPWHTEEVTRGDNVRRHYEKQTHCKSGHEFTPENTRRHSTTGHRICRTCDKEARIRRRNRHSQPPT